MKSLSMLAVSASILLGKFSTAQTKGQKCNKMNTKDSTEQYTFRLMDITISASIE
jgi:hypothetical protein